MLVPFPNKIKKISLYHHDELDRTFFFLTYETLNKTYQWLQSTYI